MAVNILEYSTHEEEQKIKLDLDNLSEVLCQPELETKPVAIVGIAGPFRSGKSFLLSFVLRYLQNRGWENPQWIGDGDKCADDGILWRSGITAHTKGIHIWNKIFYVPTENNETMAVLLIDTQGLFDFTMRKEENTKLFTFTMLLCSNLILNIKDVINKRELESLQFFSEYAKSAATELDNQSPFQRLMFLMRDWQHSSNHAYGLVGGNEYLSDVLRQVPTSTENTNLRVNLESTFEKLECFLMPHPGDCVKKKEFVGRNRELDPEFLKYVKELVWTIFHPNNLQAKSYGGGSLTGRSLWKLLQSCERTFVSGTLPKVEDVTTAFTRMYSSTAMEKAINTFKQSFENKQKECTKRDGNLTEFYEEAIKQALEHFKKETRFGSEEVKRKYRQDLISECQDLYKTYTEFDGLRQITARNFSSDKVHEIWSRYVEKMKKDMQGKYQPEVDLNRMHRTHSENALRSYQEETSVEVAFHEEHLTLLEMELIAHSFQKLKKVNDERDCLEQLGAVNEQGEFRLEYEASLFLHRISRQYREELQKFAAVYVEEESFKKQMDKMHSKYFEIFQENWDRNGANIELFLEKFVETLNEECQDALKVNERNKKLFESRFEESGMRVKAHYRKIMFGIIERNYVDPETLQKEHENTSNTLLGGFKSEFDEVTGKTKDQVICEIKQAIEDMYRSVKEKNSVHKNEKPPHDPKAPFFQVETLFAAIKIVPSIIWKYRVLIGLAEDIYVGGKKVVAFAATVLPSKEAAIAALPSAGTAAVAVGGVPLVAYGVYKYYNRKQANMIEQ